MQRSLNHGRVSSQSPASAYRVRSLSLGALLILALFALCGYPRPAGPTPPTQPGPSQLLWLELNIPAFRLNVWTDSTLVRSYAVAVGMRRYKTPTGDFEIARIIWNPWWYPPDAEWAALDTVTPPGPRNPMGKVKLMFNGPYYLHGTPTVSSLGHAASHGCVRMRNADAVELAQLVQRYGGLQVTDALLDTLTNTWRKTRVFKLERFVSVTIVYRTAEVSDSVLTLFPDVYRRHPRGLYSSAMLALYDAGIDTISIQKRLVRRLARTAAVSVASMPIQQLTAPVAEGGILP